MENLFCDSNLDGFFFKYKSFPVSEDDGGAVNRLFEPVSKGVLWFASPMTLNDPFDANPVYTMPKSDEGRRRWAKDFTEKNGREPGQTDFAAAEALMCSRNIRYGISNCVGIYCVSQALREPLLWSYYAESHTGFAYVFRRENSGFCENFRPVHYLHQRPEFCSYDHLGEAGSIRLFSAKSIHWAHEKEWRALGDPGLVEFDNKCLVAIVAGVHTSYENMVRLLKLVQGARHEMQLYWMRLSDQSYSLEIDLVSGTSLEMALDSGLMPFRS